MGRPGVSIGVRAPVWGLGLFPVPGMATDTVCNSGTYTFLKRRVAETVDR